MKDNWSEFDKVNPCACPAEKKNIFTCMWCAIKTGLHVWAMIFKSK